MPTAPNSPSGPPSAPNEPDDNGWGTVFRSQIALWVYLAILLALGVHLALNWRAADPPQVEYSTFLDYVEQGYVERVEIVNDARIRGTYTAAAVREGDVKTRSVGGSEGTGGLGPDARRAFRTTKPSDHNLVDLLRTHNDQVGARGTVVQFTATVQDDWTSSVLFWLLPLALIAGLWFVVARRMGPGSEMLNIGKSTATLFEASDAHDVTFADVAGLEEAKAEVAEVVEFLRSPEKFTRLGGHLPKGVLLVGPPGTGKTLMAKAVAGEAGVPFFSISGSDFVEMFVGVGASRVRDLFESAKEKAPCIIFIDEMDAIGRSRGQNNRVGGNDERENTLNQLLAEMDGFDSDEGVIIMAATNRPDVLDSALLRPGRFDRQILVEKPERPARKEIFHVHIRDLRLADDLDLDLLARQTPGFAGAEIANVCNEAALLAARDDEDAVGMTHFEQAIDRVVAGLEKKNKIIAPEERKVIAYHESGHAIVGWFLEHTDPVVKVSIVPRGLSALGHAQYLPEERSLYSTEALMDRITMALGGRVAEAIVFGRVTTGAQDDLERITKMAYAMVVDYGMSDRVGDVSYDLSDEERPLLEKPYSDATAQAIDEEVRRIIETARERAHTLLEDKRELLESMAEALLEDEVLGPEALVDLLGEWPHGDYVAVNGQGPDGSDSPRASDDGVPAERTAPTDPTASG